MLLWSGLSELPAFAHTRPVLRLDLATLTQNQAFSPVTGGAAASSPASCLTCVNMETLVLAESFWVYGETGSTDERNQSVLNRG